MPAIELQRLTAEITQMISQFDQVDRLHGSLVHLMEKYANWSFRPGQTTYRNTQLPSYYTPAIVTQRLIQALKPKCQANPAVALELISRLRQGKYMELRLLAIQILAFVPIDDAQVTMNEVTGWSRSEKEALVLEDLFNTGCGPLRAAFPRVWLSGIEQWVSGTDTDARLNGLRAAIASARDDRFDYLPNLYQLCSSLLMTVPQGTQALLEELLEAFIERSPAETSFFLRQILLRKSSPQTARLIRKKLGRMPIYYQPELRALLFGQGRSTDDESENPGQRP